MNRFFCSFLLLSVLISCSSYGKEQNIYKQELKAFESMPQYKTLFDEDAHVGVKKLQRDVENYKHLSYRQRFVRFAFLALDSVVVTPETMPALYSYVETMCKKHAIATPTIFITTEKGFFNAFAQKLLMSSGAIIIGKKFLEETSQQELQAVVAHEIGHIKYNHVNKTLALSWSCFVGVCVLSEYVLDHYSETANTDPSAWKYIKKYIIYNFMSNILTNLIINKRFERQADEFAFKENDNGKGLIEFFEHLQKKEQKIDDDFDATHQLIKDSYEKIADDYFELKYSYYIIKGSHLLDKAFSWVYHNTPLGAHPSHEDRIKAVQEYFAAMN